jgi:type IV secretory pathway VirB10-like protein
MAKKGFERLSNTKTRTLLLLGGLFLVVLVLIIYMSTKKASPLKTEQSKAAAIPQITSVPGNVTSPKYQELQEEENRRKVEEAKKTGGSAVATIIGARGKDGLSNRETFGIEGLGECRCPQETTLGADNIPILDPALASKLIAQIEANPKDALRLMKANPGLARAICNQKPDLALKIIETDKEAAKIMLNECPAMAKQLAEKNPALFKQLLLENPALAKKIADSSPELMKKLMLQDPEFAKQLAQKNPAMLKELMKNDPDFTDQLAKQNPELVKQLMKDDPEFAKVMAKNNPAMVKKFMLEDPEFARTMAAKNPEMVKNLMRGDPEFARHLAETNPSLVKGLMKGDPAFAALMMKQNPDMVKKLMLDDPEFARAMAQQNPDEVAQMMKDDPEFAKALRAKVPGIDAIIDAGRKKLPMTDKERLAALEDARRKQREDQAQKAQQLKLSELQQKQVAAIVANMENQSKDAMAAWNLITPQAFVQGSENEKKGNGSESGSGSGGTSGSSSTPNPNAEILIKAGTILFAVLDTAVNSDEPGPILATITGGKYEGAKALGEIQLASQPGSGGRPEKVILNFTQLSKPEDASIKSLTIKAVAIDLDTARTALASDVDHHYLLRYGTLFASSFLTGYAKVLTTQGATTQTNPASGTTTTSTAELNGRQQVFAALGEVGKQFGAATATYFSTPNTITVDSGTGIGILILSDVTAS